MRTCATRFLGWVCLLTVLGLAHFTPTASGVSFSWDPSPDQATGKVLGYKFYYSAQSFTSLPPDVATNPAFKILTLTTTSSVDLADLVQGVTYYMAVTAFGANEESVPSNILIYTEPLLAPPSVAITNPRGAISVATTNVVTVTASATGSASIAKVEFFDGSFLLTTKTVAPYSFSSSFTAGTHIITAKATDVNNLSSVSGPLTITSTAIVQNPPNVPPSVAITSPANNATFAVEAVVAVTASAADSDGSIAKVEFYDGQTLIATKTIAPYAFNWTLFDSGVRVFTARATDNAGAVTTSAPVTVTVSANQPPTVVLTSPLNNATFGTNETVSVAATATDVDGSIAKVEFFDGANLVGTVTAAPYSIEVSTLLAGPHTITAIATDNVGAATTSLASVITIRANQSPTVSLTSPTRNSSFFTTDTLTLAATASDTDGSIAKVEFYDGSVLLGVATASPYTVQVSGLTAGSHTLTCKATDNKGAVTSSKTIPITLKANAAPTVALAGLTEGALLSQPVALTATAADPDGSVTSVEFFVGNTSLGVKTTAPYTISAPIVSGSYVFKVKATDNNGGVTFSAPITAIVKPTPPVNLTVK